MKLTKRLKVLQLFGDHLLAMRKQHGSKYVVKYLKASNLAIQRCVAGSPLASLRELEADLPLPRLINGLPAFINIYDRKAIRRGDATIMRFWITLFSIYRVLSIPGDLKLNTITDPTTAKPEDLKSVGKHLKALCFEVLPWFDRSFLRRGPRILPLETASPSFTIS